MSKNKKTLVVGIDAACWDYIDPLLRSGRMPTLDHLKANGSWGKMLSTMPPWTPAAWSTIVTGKNPGKHGIFDLLWKRPRSYEFMPTNASHVVGTPFWNHLNEYGIKTGIVNVPFSHPPKPLNGFMVCGFGTPNIVPDIAYPGEVKDWINDKFNGFKPEVDAEILATATPQEIFLAEKNQQETFVKIAGELSNIHQTDVLVINLMFPDHANHKMPEMRQVREAYIQTDRDLTKLIKAYRPENVLLFSDHGSNRLNGDFMLDAWLRDREYYSVLETTAAERFANLNWLLKQYIQEYLGWSGIREKIFRRLLGEYIFRLPDEFSEKFWNKIEAVFPNARDYLQLTGKPDYASSKVFSGSVYSGLLYLNLTNREKSGVIPFEKRKEIVDEIATQLARVEDPITGDSLFSNIYFSEDLYTGPAVMNAPDLILDGYQMGWNLRMSKSYFPSPPKTIVNKYFVTDADRRDFGWHTREGIFVFSGPAFINGTAPFDAELFDIPATLLHLFGAPIPEDYDGTVRTEIMVKEYSNLPVKYQSGDTTDRNEEAYSSEETKALLSHLRALGYLD